MLRRIRDNSSQHTLTSLIYMDVDLDMMTVEFCTNYCNDNKKALAGLEDGHNCCECLERRCRASCGFETSFMFITY